MEPRKLGIILFVFLTAAIITVPVAGVSLAVHPVDSKTAEDIAATHMKEISGISSDYADWADGSVEKSIIYHDLDGRDAAYLYNVNVKGSYAGYILVSASRDNFPVLEFSRGKVPNADPGVLLKSDEAIRSSVRDTDLRIGSPEMIYLGGTFYLAKYPITNSRGIVVDTRFVDLMEQKEIDPTARSADDLLDSDSLVLYKKQKTSDVEKGWSAYEAGKTGQTMTTDTRLSRAYGSSTISGVPFWPYTLACCPTAGGMVLSYWRTHGYSAIPADRSTLAQELYTAMGTTGTQTSIWTVDDGMNTVIANHGYSYNSLHIDEDSWVSFDEAQREINAVKPFTLTMTAAGAAVGNTQSYGDHSVAVVGYTSTSSGDYIIINDGWSTSSTRNLAFGNWRGAIGGYSRPV